MPALTHSLEAGRGIQVVTPGPDHTFILDEDALSKLLLQEDIRDRSVVVISVAGAFRTGKSFLLNFLLRYLNDKYNLGKSDGEWIGSEKQPLKGFSWRGGSKRDTTGLLLWSQPFKATLDNGEKVVILLMDTQGTFDGESTVKDNATMFALSTLLSSVQIYNLLNHIREDYLQHLQHFTEYGRLAQQGSAGKPFQKLQFLVRDWSYPHEFDYGAAGGKKLLAEKLKVSEDQHEELRNLRNHITTCFEDMSCFLMPHPGLEVSSDPDFNGSLADLNPKFITALKQLVPMLLAPGNLVPKVIHGQKVKAKDLLIYFKSYMETFSGPDMPLTKTIFQATVEANNLTAVAKAKEVYETIMEETCGGTKPYFKLRRLIDEHHRAMDGALEVFDRQKKMGGEKLAVSYREQLIKQLEDNFTKFRAHNEAKKPSSGFPTIFLIVGVVGYLIGVLGALLGLQTLAVLGQTALYAAIVVLVIWGYNRINGTMGELLTQIVDFANYIRNFRINIPFMRMRQ